MPSPDDLSDLIGRPSLDIHLMGICGTGMGSFAGLLQAAGHRVRGSDQNVYPPMSEKLAAWGIPVQSGYSPDNLSPRPDLVVVGNVIRRDNPEAEAAQAFRQVSFPQALGDLFLKNRRSLVVAGTHGKTTTTSLLAWILAFAQRDPSFLVGGVPTNFGEGFRLGSGRHFVIEGDEYDTAYFDKRPKFLHYQPAVAVLTSIEFDHADIYPSLEAIEARFDDLVDLVPPAGRVLACASYPSVLSRRRTWPGDWQTYSAQDGVDAKWKAESIRFGPTGVDFGLHRDGTSLGELYVPMSGLHNVENAMAAVVVALQEGVSFEQVKEALRTFEGIARRQSVFAEPNGITLIDDFAHHPTAVRQTLDGLRRRYEARRIVAVFEPRTATSSRDVFQNQYADSFGGADRVLIAPVGKTNLSGARPLSVHQLAKDLTDRGVEASAYGSIDALGDAINETAQTGDVVVFMSNGGFGGIHSRIASDLSQVDSNKD